MEYLVIAQCHTSIGSDGPWGPSNDNYLVPPIVLRTITRNAK